MSILNRFSKFLHCWKFATRYLHSFPSHLDYVVTQPWEVKSPNLYYSKIVCNKSETLHVIWLKAY